MAVINLRSPRLVEENTSWGVRGGSGAWCRGCGCVVIVGYCRVCVCGGWGYSRALPFGSCEFIDIYFLLCRFYRGMILLDTKVIDLSYLTNIKALWYFDLCDADRLLIQFYSLFLSLNNRCVNDWIRLIISYHSLLVTVSIVQDGVMMNSNWAI